jgi:hypothetical protein
MIEIERKKVLSWFVKPEGVSNKVKFSYFRIESNSEVILFNEKEKTSENLTEKLGVRGKAFLSSQEEERASVFFFPEGESVCKRVDFFFPKEGGMAMDVAEYSLGFGLSEDFSAHAKNRSVIVVDIKNKRYVFINSRGESLSSSIEIEDGAFCYVIDDNRAAIADRERLYVIVEGRRALYELGDIEKKNNSPISQPLFGVGECGGYEWLAFKDEKWHSSCILVSIGEKETLGFMVYEFQE